MEYGEEMSENPRFDVFRCDLTRHYSFLLFMEDI